MYSKLRDFSSLEGSIKISPAPFIQSKVHKAKVQLIKVPKYVAEAWASAEHKSIVGVLRKSDKHEGNELVVLTNNLDENEGKKISVLDEKKKANTNLFVMQTKMKNSNSADICGFVDRMSTFVPKFDSNYQQSLRKRYREKSDYRGRATTEETRKEDYDSSKTLFQYFNPRRHEDVYGNTLNVDGSRKYAFEMTSQRTTKAKQKKVVTMTEDTLRMRIFQLFEKAGEEGLTLKRVVMELDQPLNFVKSVLEELGEQRRRASDRRIVYFLKGHYSSSTDKLNG